MPGVVGGTVDEETLDSHLRALYREDWYESTARTTDGMGGAIVHHGTKDRNSDELWCEDGRLGLLHGVISANRGEPLTTGELFRGVLERPDDILPDLEGPFALAAIDTEANLVRLATDKAGSRPCYYTAQNGFYFASEVKPLLEPLDDIEINVQAVSDLLAFGTVYGEKTLVEGVHNLPPATYLTYGDGDVSTERYWYPTFEASSPSSYVDDWLGTYQRATVDVIDTVDDQLGLWLSGGLDSRVAAAVLDRAGCEFEAFTYANGERGNRRIAARVADQLDVPHRSISPASTEQFIESIRQCIDVNDAMQSWGYVPALSYMFHQLADDVDVVLEGGTFLGEDVWSYHTSNDISPVETVYHKRSWLSEEAVSTLVADPVDPKRSVRMELRHCRANAAGDRSLDAMRRAYSYHHMRSNVIQRSQAGTRVVSDGAVLNHVLNMPDEHRMRTVPGTAGRLPLGVPRIKLEVMRCLDDGLDDIPYQRTSAPPTAPLWRHVVGFYAGQLRDRLTADRQETKLRRYRTDRRVARFLDGLIEDACERPFLDGDAVRCLRDQVRDGDSDNVISFAALTGLELWLQRHVDPRRSKATVQTMRAHSTLS